MPKSPSRRQATQLTLIYRLQEGADERDWSQFHGFYWQVITGWARAKGCPPDLAEDIYQDTIVSLLRYLPTFDPAKSRFRAFLKTITMRRVADAWRRHYRDHQSGEWAEDGSGRPLVSELEELPLPDPVADEVTPEESVWLAGIVGEAVRRTYERIDDTTYKSFCRNLLEGASVDDVCRELGLNQNAVYAQKSRSLTILCDELQTVLAELGEVGTIDLSAGGDSSRQAVRQALEAYLANRQSLRATGAVTEAASYIQARVMDFARLLAEHPPPSPDAAWLRVFDAEREWWAEVTDGMTIGSRDTCDLRLSSAGVSRLHAQIALSAGGWQIVDQRSTHGVWVGGKRVAEKLLLGGDQIQLGSTLLYFVPA